MIEQNSGDQDTENDKTPTPKSLSKELKKYSNVSISSTGESSLDIYSKEILEALEKHDRSITESEYYTAQSDFNSNASSSIWK